jgi:uncharacterized alpha-E superfamily protein
MTVPATALASAPLLSRVADAVYWMSRYIERVENVARFVDVNLHLMLDLPTEHVNQWLPLVATSGDLPLFEKRYAGGAQENVIRFLTFDTDNPNSIVSCLQAARENARSVRETISSEMWEQINGMYLMMRAANSEMLTTESLPDLFHRVRMACHLFQGITDVTMTHNEAWHFIRLGRKIERADKTTRLLDMKYFILLPSVSDVGTPYDDIQWSAVLKSVSGFEMYRKKYGRIYPNKIVEFLVFDREFPRAVHFCILRAQESLHVITGTPIGSYRLSSEQRLGQLRAELDYSSVEAILLSGLHEFLDGLQVKLNTIDDCVQANFFAQG